MVSIWEEAFRDFKNRERVIASTAAGSVISGRAVNGKFVADDLESLAAELTALGETDGDLE